MKGGFFFFLSLAESRIFTHKLALYGVQCKRTEVRKPACNPQAGSCLKFQVPEQPKHINRYWGTRRGTCRALSSNQNVEYLLPVNNEIKDTRCAFCAIAARTGRFDVPENVEPTNEFQREFNRSFLLIFLILLTPAMEIVREKRRPKLMQISEVLGGER